MNNKQRLMALPQNQRTEHIVLKTIEMAHEHGLNCAYAKFYEWLNQEIEKQNNPEVNNG